MTNANQTATLNVARIGKVVIAPNSVAHLTRTRPGQHRIELEQGRLHARIWAPPGHFGVTHGEMRFTDLGCEFDLNVDAAGSGTLNVASGWVVYGHRGDEILVPEGYSLTFDASAGRTPLRGDAPPTFSNEVRELDVRLDAQASTDEPAVIALTNSLAATARDDDYFTLLHLLVRHPQLAQGSLYPRLASALGIEAIDESHRARWASGDAGAREAWWDRLPKSPKTWWLNWRDAL